MNELDKRAWDGMRDDVPTNMSGGTEMNDEEELASVIYSTGLLFTAGDCDDMAKAIADAGYKKQPTINIQSALVHEGKPIRVEKVCEKTKQSERYWNIETTTLRPNQKYEVYIREVKG